MENHPLDITPTQKATIQTSFKLLENVWGEAAALFYRRLFELDPALRPLFKVAISEQERKFMDMLRIMVFGLDYPDQLIPALQLLGERHTAYGVQTAHYRTVETALLWMLEQGLEDQFTPEMKAAWELVYARLVEIMLNVPAK